MLNVKRSVKVYGFGSAFYNVDAVEDVDFLIVHHDNELPNCQLAIRCKQILMKQIARAHVTMLSTSEEADIQFIRISRAVQLGVVRATHIEDDIAALVALTQKQEFLSQSNLGD
jgi:hypothetical protein